MPAQITGSQATAAMLNRAFRDISPSYLTFQNQVSAIDAAKLKLGTPAGDYSYANEFGKSFAGLSNAQLAEKILTNMGVYKLASGAVNTDLVTLVVDAFTLLPNDRGQLVLRLAEILTTLEFATGALSIYNAAAVSWNDEVTATLAYSGISTNTTESASGDNTDLLKSYKLSPVSVAAVSEGATALFNLVTSGIKDGTTIAYTLSGVSAADVTGSLTGVATVVGGKATISVALAADHTNEGIETLTVALDNGKAVSSVDVNDTSVNSAPVMAATAAASVAENTTAVLTAAATDADAGDTVTYTLSGTDAALFNVSATGEVTFKTAPNFEVDAKTYSFNIVATDSGTTSKTATQAVTVTVTDVNEAPVTAAAATATVAENSTAVGTYTTTDPDAGDVLTYSLSGADAAKFSISAAGVVAFVAAPNFEVDAKSYAINVVATDKAGLTASQAVTVNVTDVNEAPTAGAAATATVVENSTAVGTYAAADVDAGDSLTYTLSGADAGKFTVDASGVVAFAAAPNFEVDATSYSINVVATDKGGLASSQAVTVGVTNVNEAPVAVADTLATQALASNNTYVIDIASVLGNDTDVDAGDVLSIASVSDAVGGGGTVSLNGGTKVVFIANDPSIRTGSFNYTVKDAAGLTSTATATFTINSAPVGTAATVNGTEDVTISGTVVAVDPNSDTMTYSLGTQGTKGLATVNADGTYTYVPTLNANGTDTFTFIAKDSYGVSSAPTTITVNLAAVDDAPSLVSPAPATISAVAGTTFTVDLSTYATDVDTAAGALVYTLTGATTAKGGTVTVVGNTATVVYPAGGGSAALGADTFGFTVTDGVNPAVPATVNITVANGAVVGTADSFGTGSGKTVTNTSGVAVEKVVSGQVYSVNVLANDDDGDATAVQALTISSVTQPTQGGLVEITNAAGTVVGAGGTLIKFNSTPGYAGNVTFSYVVSDGFATSTATVTIVVEAQLGGTTGDDLLVGTPAAETLEGGAGNDTIDGGSGADKIDAGADNDSVTARGPETNINGGTGVDILVIAATNNALTAVDLSSGVDQTTTDTPTVTGFENVDASAVSQNLAITDASATTIIKSGAGIDTINLTNSANVLVDAGGANDTINIAPSALTSADSIGGGAGADTLVLTATAIAVVDAQFTNVTSVETLKLADSDNAQSVVLGTAAQAAGIATVNLSAVTPTAASTITVSASAYAATSGISFIASNDQCADQVLTGGAGNDTFTFNTTSVVDTTTGNVAAGSVDVTIAGGTGTDTITVGNDANGDQIGNAAQINIDTNVTGIEAVQVLDTAVDDAAGDVTVSFSAGYAQTTTLSIDGSQLDAGETLLVNAAANATNESLSVTGGAGDDSFTVGDAANTLVGGSGVDTITAGSGANSISGGAGADLITIGAGLNTVSGGDGDDKVTVGGGNQNLSGDAGSDGFTIDVDNLTSADTIVGGDGTDSLILVDADADLVTDALLTNVTLVETLVLNTANFTSAVTLGAEALEAGIVTVTMSAANANNDIVTLHNAGVTVNNAACGADSVTGGTGNDTFVVAAAQFDSTAGGDTLAGGAGTDTLSVSNAADALATLGVNTATLENVKVADATTGTDGDVTISFDAGYTQTTITIDGSDMDAGETLSVVATANTASEGVVVLGGAGSDSITLGGGTDNVSGNAGDDTVTIDEDNLLSSDTIVGGAGTDNITLVDGDADTVVDNQFTNVTLVETLVLNTNNFTSAVTLGAEAREAGIVTVTMGSVTANADVVTLHDGGVTVNNAACGADSVTGGAGNDTFVVKLTEFTSVAGGDTLAGGGGTDTLSVSNAADALATLGVNTATLENVKVADATTGTDADVTISFDAGYTQTTITIDGADMDAGETLSVDASANGAAEAIVVLGGAGSDSVGLGAGTDNVSGNAGNDGITIAVANLTSSDTIDGGAGTDTLTFSTAADVTDDKFTNVTTMETVQLGSVGAGATVSYVFGAQAQEAGITTILGGDTAAVAGKVTIDASAMTSNLTITLTSDGGNVVYDVAGGSGNDTITMGNTSTVESGLVQGGAGGDTITLSAAAGSNDQLRVNLASHIAAGTTLANADKVTGFTEGAGTDTDADGIFSDILDTNEDDDAVDAIEFVGATLQSGGGGLNPLSTTLDNFNVASDIFNATVLSQLSSFSTGGASSAYVITVDAAVKTTTADLRTQAGIDEAVAYLTANGIAATTVASTKILLAIGDGDDLAFFLYDEGATSEAGIQAAELSLVGVYDIANSGALNIANLV